MCCMTFLSSAHKGETVAIIGSTGCGKSTVINLIPRFYDATEGQVLVDGVDVRDYKQKIAPEQDRLCVPESDAVCRYGPQQCRLRR